MYTKELQWVRREYSRRTHHDTGSRLVVGTGVSAAVVVEAGALAVIALLGSSAIVPTAHRDHLLGERILLAGRIHLFDRPHDDRRLLSYPSFIEMSNKF